MNPRLSPIRLTIIDFLGVFFPGIIWVMLLMTAHRLVTDPNVDPMVILLKGCTKMALPPLQAASNLALQASDARESLPQLIFVALHATNLGQLLEDVPFFFVRKTLLERSLLVTDALGSRGEPWR
jgi:hypothetical protein